MTLVMTGRQSTMEFEMQLLVHYICLFSVSCSLFVNVNETGLQL